MNYAKWYESLSAEECEHHCAHCPVRKLCDEIEDEDLTCDEIFEMLEPGAGGVEPCAVCTNKEWLCFRDCDKRLRSEEEIE